MPTVRAARAICRSGAPLGLVLVVAGAAVGLGAGCAKDASQSNSALKPADFRAVPVASGGAGEGAGGGEDAASGTVDGGSAGAGASGAAPAAAATLPRRPIRMVAASEAWGGVLDVSVVPGPPRAETPAPGAASAAVTLDSKVGEINGQPIIASKFLEPLDGRLRALAKETQGRPAVWRTQARRIIVQALEAQIVDQLLLAEAYASLTPEVREIGLRSFLTQIREDLVRQNEGSRELADERLQEREGISIEQKSKDALHQEMIRHELRRRIEPRVHVSTRDQRDYYDRNFAQFNPPGTARLRLIRVPETDVDAVERVRESLAAGTAFEEIARLEINTFNASAGGERLVPVPGAYEDAEFFGVTELNEAARALEPDDTIGPIPGQRMMTWLHLEAIDRPGGVSFYDAQLDINQHLLDERARMERVRYFSKLMTRGSFSDTALTTERLLTIATERYFGAAGE